MIYLVLERGEGRDKEERNIDVSKKRPLALAVWLSALSAGLGPKGSLVRFPMRTHVWVADWIPSGRACDRQAHIDVFLPLFLSPFPSLYE